MGTVEAWYEALTFNRVWYEERDVPRIRESFNTIMRTKKAWPAPAEFIECMPVIRDNWDSLPSRVFSDAERLANLAKLESLAKDALK